MSEPDSIYTQKIKAFTKALSGVKKQLLASSIFRLVIFVAVILGSIFLWGNTRWVIAIVFVGIVIFFALVSRHVNLRYKRDRLKALIRINSTELRVLDRNFSKLPSGKSYKTPHHAFGHDIDLFGKHSFFQYLNRTALTEGEANLAAILKENAITQIEKKQEAVAELGEKIDFRQEFSALATLTASDQDESPSPDVHKNIKLLQAHRHFTPKYAKPISTGFSLISIIAIAAYIFGFISGMQLSVWLIIGLAITGIYLKRVNALQAKVGKMQKVFQQYHKLLELLENTEFSAELLCRQQETIAVKGQKASDIIKGFSRAIDNLDQRGNLLFGFLGNGFLLWDLRQSATLEKWMATYVNHLDSWFKVIATMDAYNSLGNFSFNHPHYVFPEITDNQTIIKARAAVHPLIPPEEAVRNDFQIDKEQFFIITGANMAGKSTFLRTVALQIVMSNIGLPVCAEACSYTPIKLITSMRTSDSLDEEASYFYAELSRLKFIIDKLQSAPYFIVLDEILKGTNSKDKAEGSKKFLEKLASAKATGIIATHDLSLCAVADKLPRVENHYFDARIKNDELFFDYTFKAGICQNMNASFLLRKMGIVED